jgi:hypothetical protein
MRTRILRVQRAETCMPASAKPRFMRCTKLTYAVLQGRLSRNQLGMEAHYLAEQAASRASLPHLGEASSLILQDINC